MLSQCDLPLPYLLKARGKITTHDIGPGRKKTGVLFLAFYPGKHEDDWQRDQGFYLRSREKTRKKPGSSSPKKEPGSSTIYKALNMKAKFSSGKFRGKKTIITNCYISGSLN